MPILIEPGIYFSHLDLYFTPDLNEIWEHETLGQMFVINMKTNTITRKRTGETKKFNMDDGVISFPAFKL